MFLESFKVGFDAHERYFFRTNNKVAENDHPRYWKNQDIADFYRAVEILKQAGLHTEVDSGVTDEGDPWFVFLRPENGDVIAHFALVDNVFVAVSSINHKVYRGKKYPRCSGSNVNLIPCFASAK